MRQRTARQGEEEEEDPFHVTKTRVDESSAVAILHEGLILRSRHAKEPCRTPPLSLYRTPCGDAHTQTSIYCHPPVAFRARRWTCARQCDAEGVRYGAIWHAR